MGLSLPKSNLIFLKKCLDKWVHFSAALIESFDVDRTTPEKLVEMAQNLGVDIYKYKV